MAIICSTECSEVVYPLNGQICQLTSGSAVCLELLKITKSLLYLVIQSEYAYLSLQASVY